MAPPTKKVRQQQLVFGAVPGSQALELASQTTSTNSDLSDLDSSHLSNPDFPAMETPQESSSPASLVFTSRTIKKKRTCWVYKHMRGTDDMETIFKNQKGEKEWRCRYCMTDYQLSGGTSNIEKHLSKIHELFEDSPKDKRAKNQQIVLDQAMASAESNPQKRRRLNYDEATTDINPDVLEVLYVRFISACNQSLRLVECPEFRALLAYLNRDIEIWLPDSHPTIAEWVKRQYHIEKGVKKQRLHAAWSKIHVSLDMWTSTNNKPVMGVTATYTAEDGALETITLALKEVIGVHEGKNLASVFMEVIKEWEIASQLGFFVLDNAANNDTMMQYISLGT
jgi:hypothetical protein